MEKGRGGRDQPAYQRVSTKYRQILGVRRQLPVHQTREAFLDAYQKARVLVVTSDTGSGKTTQIPQFVLYDQFDSGKTCFPRDGRHSVSNLPWVLEIRAVLTPDTVARK